MASSPDLCACCGRGVRLTFHHLIPRKVHRRARYKKHYDRDALNKGIHICRQCHRGIHKTYDEMTLAQHYHSLDALLADPTLRRHFDWVSKQREKY
ncbi:MAG: hypothetical protein V2I45_10500 [Halieaceae bacterium]|jgi:hypothetical protein|nr:hypothetical protein [Halieaceae bacterium]